MKVSVVIPCVNEQARIAAAVDSAWTAGATQVIVADGGSQDDTVQIAEQHSAQVVRSPMGRATQMNAGAAHAWGDVLLFLHADSRLPQDAICQIEVALTKPNSVWGAFGQRIESPKWILRAIEWGNAARVRWQGLAYGDQAIFVRRQTFESVGRFDPVPLMEDVLLSHKLSALSRPVLVRGPLHISARRWQRYGPIRQTMRNWLLMLRFRLGASPQRLARAYRRHDEKS